MRVIINNDEQDGEHGRKNGAVKLENGHVGDVVKTGSVNSTGNDDDDDDDVDEDRSQSRSQIHSQDEAESTNHNKISHNNNNNNDHAHEKSDHDEQRKHKSHAKDDAKSNNDKEEKSESQSKSDDVKKKDDKSSDKKSKYVFFVVLIMNLSSSILSPFQKFKWVYSDPRHFNQKWNKSLYLRPFDRDKILVLIILCKMKSYMFTKKKFKLKVLSVRQI